MSLRRQFILVLVTFSVALTALGGWLSWSVTSRTLEAELDDRLQLVAGAAAEVGGLPSLLEGLGPGDEDAPLLEAARARLQRMGRYVDEAYVFQRDNRLLVSTENQDSLPTGARVPWLAAFDDELSRAWDTGGSTTPMFRADDGRFYKYGFVRLDEADAMMAVLMPADFLEPLARFRRTLIIGSVLAALLAGLLAWGLASNIVEPLERLSRVALRIQRGRLSRPVDTERGDELGRLSRAMERMRRGIVQRDEQLRLMLAQVAHEIRNPLGGLELFAAAAADTDDPEERRVILFRVRREVEELNEIINDFLAFARPLQPEVELHDIRDPLREAAQLAAADLEKSNSELFLDLPDDELVAHADPEHVKRIALNLIRNAGDAGSRVWVDTDFRHGEVVVSIRDDGPGVPEEVRDKIFDPFMTEKEQGAGLGLAIVKRLSEANGGRVELVDDEDSVGEGAEFRVYFGGPEDFPG